MTAEQLQNAGPFWTIHRLSQLIWFGSGKIYMAFSVGFIYLVTCLAWQWIKE